MGFLRSYIYAMLVFFSSFLFIQENQASSLSGFGPQRSVVYIFNTQEKIDLSDFSISSDAKHYLFREGTKRLIVDGNSVFFPEQSYIVFAAFRPKSEDYYVTTFVEKQISPGQYNSKVKPPPKKLRDHFFNEVQNSVYTLYKGENKIGEFDYLSNPVFSKDGKWMLATGFKNGKAVYVLNDQVVEAGHEITRPFLDNENNVSFFVKKGGKFSWLQNGESKKEFEQIFQHQDAKPVIFAKYGNKLHLFLDGQLELISPWMEFDDVGISSIKKAPSFLFLKKQLNTGDKNKDLYNPTYNFYVAFPEKILGPFIQARVVDFAKDYWIGQELNQEKLFFKDQLLQDASSISNFLFFQNKPLYVNALQNQKWIVWGEQKWGPYSNVVFYSAEERPRFEIQNALMVVKQDGKYLLWNNGKTSPLSVKSEHENIQYVAPNSMGDHYAFVAKKWVGNEEKEFVIHDGIEDPPYLKIRDLYFSKNGKINYKALKYEFKKLGDPHQEIYVVDGQKMDARHYAKLERSKSIQLLYAHSENGNDLWVGYEKGKCKKAVLVDMYFQANIPFCEQTEKMLVLESHKKRFNLGSFDNLYSVFVSEDKKHIGIFALKDKKLYWIVEAL